MIARFLCWLFGHGWLREFNCMTDESWEQCCDCGEKRPSGLRGQSPKETP